MKKIFFVAIAAVALVFTGCKNETKAPVVEDEPVAEEVTEFTVDSLATLINAETPDTTAISSFMEGVQSQIESLKSIDPTKAQEYLAQVQQFLKDNADKIKAVVGTGALAGVIDQVNNLKPESLLEAAKDAVTDKAEEAVDAAKDKAEEAVDAAKDKAEEVVNDAKEAVGDAKAKAGEAVDAAKDKANEAIDDAKSKVGL